MSKDPCSITASLVASDILTGFWHEINKKALPAPQRIDRLKLTGHNAGST
jgi:hypothetical protein